MASETAKQMKSMKSDLERLERKNLTDVDKLRRDLARELPEMRHRRQEKKKKSKIGCNRRAC